jgi:hypothetical protein
VHSEFLFLLLSCPAVYLIVCPIPLVQMEDDPNRDGAIYINLVKLSASRQCLQSCYALAVGTNTGSKKNWRKNFAFLKVMPIGISSRDTRVII